MSGPNLQQLPNQPEQVAPEGFNLIYFFRQWTTLARIINAAIAYLNTLVIPGPTPPYVPTVAVQTDVTGSRSFGMVFTNPSSTQTMLVTGWGVNGGSSTGQITFTSGSVGTQWSNQATATVASGHTGFFGVVLPGATYEATVSGDITSLGKWVETLLAI